MRGPLVTCVLFRLRRNPGVHVLSQSFALKLKPFSQQKCQKRAWVWVVPRREGSPRVLHWHGVAMGPREQRESCILETGCKKKWRRVKMVDLAVVHRGMPLGDWCTSPEDGS